MTLFCFVFRLNFFCGLFSLWLAVSYITHNAVYLPAFVHSDLGFTSALTSPLVQFHANPIITAIVLMIL